MAAADRLIRPAIDAALGVARDGAALDPPVVPPAGLRPLLKMRRLSPTALETARRVVDDDDAFRARVAGAVDESAMGRAAWLWLARPDGWEDELAGLEAEAAAGTDAAELAGLLARARRAADRAERDRQRAEDEATRATAAATSARLEADGLRAALADARELAAGHAAEVARLADERNAAVRDLKESEARLAELRAEHKRLRRELDVGAAAPVAEARPAPEPDPVERARLVAAVERAAAALDDVRAALAPAPPVRTTRSAPVRRRPVRLPPPMLDNSVEAAAHLVRLPGVAVLVDGYNVSMAAWPGPPVAAQRDRLVEALDELQARTGADITVVFDGQTGGRRPPASTGRAVKVLFTDAGRIADDDLVALVQALPPARPALVVTSDRELQDRVRAAGGNVVSAKPFLAVLGR